MLEEKAPSKPRWQKQSRLPYVAITISTATISLSPAGLSSLLRLDRVRIEGFDSVSSASLEPPAWSLP